MKSQYFLDSILTSKILLNCNILKRKIVKQIIVKSHLWNPHNLIVKINIYELTHI